ncbi:MAG TPA: aconitase X catalytic domain-containing protein [Gemmatimonadales bacterium]
MAALTLTDADAALLDGARGPGVQLAMRVVVRMAAVQDARSLILISGAHIDSALYMGDATLAFMERLADGGATVVVPTTCNVGGVDEGGWRRWAVPSEWAERSRRQMAALETMGCRPTWTCAPYQVERRPAFGEQIAWGESNAIVFANSVLGARTERYPDMLDICAAVVGRVPAVGLHLDAPRRGTTVFDLSRLPVALQERSDFFPVLGHLIGSVVHGGVPVLIGVSSAPTEDDLKALGAAMASSGAVALFHIVGVTPEAPTLDRALHGVAADETVMVSLEQLRRARADLSSETGETLDMVVLGSPHFSFDEFRRLALLLDGRARHRRTRLLVTTSRGVRAMAESAGLLAPLDRFGGEITVDTCILTSPMLPDSVRTLMTNSAKYAYYSPGLLRRGVAFGSLADCVESAVAGRVVRDEGPWSE